MIPSLRRLENRVVRRTVTVRLVLPYIQSDGHELIVAGEGQTYDDAVADLEQKLSDWRRAFLFDATGEELAP